MVIGQALYTIGVQYYIGLFVNSSSLMGDTMNEEDNKQLASFLNDAEVKVVWREEDKTKVGRGMITNDDENFVYLTGEKGTVNVNKKDILAIKQ